MKRKKQLEYRRNCSKRKQGRKERALYFAVETRLPQKRWPVAWIRIARNSMHSAGPVAPDVRSSSSSGKKDMIK